MSSASLRFAKTVAIYSLLVVPPVAGLLAILHVGVDLRPPHSIGGDWLLAPAAPGCSAFDFAGKPITLGISQSGLRAVGKLSDASHAAISLELDGDMLAGEQDGGSGCHVELGARLASAGELVGVLRWPGCSGCSDQEFHATRAPRPGAKR